MTTDADRRPSRNEPCHCGSGRKYKQCHLEADEAEVRAAHAKAVEDAPEPSAEADTPATRSRTARPRTEQPWKRASTQGFRPPVRTPRKVGGS